MALNVRPILSYISAFDAEFGESDKGKEKLEAPIFRFSWSEGVVRKNRVRIVDYDDKTEVYNCVITTMSRTHQLHKLLNGKESIDQDTPYRLENGHKYMAYLSVFTTDNVESEPSEPVIFYCVTTPIFEFTNFSEFSGDGANTIAIVQSSSLDCVVKYTSDTKEQECLSSYYYELIDFNGKTLFKSKIKYSSEWNDTLRFTIGGVNETSQDNLGNINYDERYIIRCVGETQHGLVVNTEQKFIVKLPVSGVGSLIKVKNIGDGRVSISSNYKIMNVQCSNENPKYILDEKGNPYAIDLTQGDYVEFIDGFVMQKPYEFIMKGEFLPGQLVTLRGVGDKIEGTDEYTYNYGYVFLKKIEYTVQPFYYFSFCIEQDGIVYEIRTHYFENQTDLVSAEVDLSYQDGLYNIKAKINYDSTYVVTNDSSENVIFK